MESERGGEEGAGPTRWCEELFRRRNMVMHRVSPRGATTEDENANVQETSPDVD